MNLPFTAEEFFEVFAKYNNAVYPIQIIFALAAFFILLVIFKRFTKLYSLTWLILALFWAWVGVVYHIKFFSPINPVAKVFGVLFIVESILLTYYGAIKKKIEFDYKPGVNIYIGIFLLTYSLLIYPLITIATGHSYPSLPTFGVPCPTTIYTIGLFFLTNLSATPKKLFIIPILWSLIATTAAVKLYVYADIVLIVSSLLLIISLLTGKNRKTVLQ